MTNTTQNPGTCTRWALAKRTSYSLEVEAELEASDRRAGHEYVPMDVFINPRTMKQHFQISSLRAG
jgi:hypothetical protein